MGQAAACCRSPGNADTSSDIVGLGDAQQKSGTQAEFNQVVNCTPTPSLGPDTETWEGSYDPKFVNGMLAAVWPMVDKFSKHIVESVVEPAVQRALDELGPSFHIEKDTYKLGKAMQFGSMSISESIQHTSDLEEPKMRVMVLRTAILWEAEITAYANFAGIRMGLTKLRLEGDLVIELVGEMPKPPLFKGIRACFVNPPKIDIEVHSETTVLDKVAGLGATKDTIRKVTEEQLSQRLVAPNRMGVRLDKDSDIFRVLHPRPRGILVLQVCKTDHLTAIHHHLLSEKSSKAFVKASCGAIHMETPAIEGTKVVNYNTQFFIPIHNPGEQLLHLQVIDKTFLKKETMLGIQTIAIADLIRRGNQETVCELQDPEGKRTKNGSVTLKAEWRELLLQVAPQIPTSVATPATSLATPASSLSHLFVGVYSAKNMPAGEPWTKFWVEVQCTTRLGLGRADIEKAKATKRVMMQAMSSSTEEAEAAAELLKERKALCQKYKMSAAHIQKLLGNDGENGVGKLDPTISWNYPIEFFLGNYSEAVISVALKCTGIGHPEGPKESSLLSQLAGMAQHKIGAAASKMMGEDGSVIGSWDIKVASLLERRGGTSTQVLRVGDSSTMLSLRLQLRSLGEPGTDFE